MRLAYRASAFVAEGLARQRVLQVIDSIVINYGGTVAEGLARQRVLQVWRIDPSGVSVT